MLVAVIADTHLPKKGARRLPDLCVEWIAKADALIHAGDISTVGVLRELEAICPELPRFTETSTSQPFAVHSRLRVRSSSAGGASACSTTLGRRMAAFSA